MDRVQDPGAFYAAQQVLPTLVEAGRGTIVLTGASASLRGKARFSPLAVGKFGLRALAQSMAPEREENTMLARRYSRDLLAAPHPGPDGLDAGARPAPLYG